MMKDWKRIVFVVFFLFGATLLFGYWSINQFNDAFDSLTASLTTPIPPVDPRSTISETSTSPTDQDNLDSKFQLIFSLKGGVVYIGCAYEISWLASTTIKSLEAALIDNGTRKPADPNAGGLTKENTIEANSQSLEWKVRVVRPGEYFISISHVNGVATDERSQKFTIKGLPDGSDEKEQKNLCEGTGGNLL